MRSQMKIGQQKSTETHQQSIMYENMNPGLKNQSCNFCQNKIMRNMTYQFLIMVETGISKVKIRDIPNPVGRRHLQKMPLYDLSPSTPF